MLSMHADVFPAESFHDGVADVVGVVLLLLLLWLLLMLLLLLLLLLL